MSDKIFIGRYDVKPRTGVNGDWEDESISFGPKDFELLERYKNAKGWINIKVQTSKNTGKKYLEVSQFVPTRPSGLENTPQLPPTPDEAAMPWDDSNF